MYLEDYSVGQTFDIDEVVATREDILRYANEFDPRPFHIDDEAAAKTRFGKIFASGFHTLSLCWSQWVKTKIDEDGVIAGIGLDHVRWKHPVFIGDTLKSTVEVIEISQSKNKKRGVVKFLMKSKNQRNEEILEVIGIVLVASKNI